MTDKPLPRCPTCNSIDPAVCCWQVPDAEDQELLDAGPHLHGVQPQGSTACCEDSFHEPRVERMLDGVRDNWRNMENLVEGIRLELDIHAPKRR
jgi:hypothetical protein